jgi:hypothetical protein
MYLWNTHIYTKSSNYMAQKIHIMLAMPLSFIFHFYPIKFQCILNLYNVYHCPLIHMEQKIGTGVVDKLGISYLFSTPTKHIMFQNSNDSSLKP